jgi:regulatory protein
MRTRRNKPSGNPGFTTEAREDVEGLSAAIWRLLAVRARSRTELRTRLLRRGFNSAAIDQELDRLERLGFIDDQAFARSWVASRGSNAAPRGPALLRAELRQKGIDAELARAAVDEAGDTGAAAVAARRRGAALSALPYREFRRRLLTYLLRRGFDYETGRSAVEEVWKSLGEPTPPSS